MTLRHAAALVLVGWYLMVPPFIGSMGVADQKPISVWQRFGPYKYEADCVNSKSQWEEFLEAPPSANDVGQERDLMAFQEASCLSANDPRLRENQPEEKNVPAE